MFMKGETGWSTDAGAGDSQAEVPITSDVWEGGAVVNDATPTERIVAYTDIDEATRSQMWKSTVNKREQVVGELWRMTIDTEHWSRVNPDEDPIQMPLDFTDDIEWRRNAPKDDEKAS